MILTGKYAAFYNLLWLLFCYGHSNYLPTGPDAVEQGISIRPIQISKTNSTCCSVPHVT